MTAPITRLPRWQEWAVYLAIAGLTTSGTLWLLFHYWVSVDGEFGRAPHPLESWWLKIHGAFGMFTLIVLGSLLPNHMVKAWQRHRNRLTGGVNAAMFLLLALSGYLLYYLGDDTWRGWTSVAHWGIGLGLPLVTLVHVVSGHRRPALDRRRQATAEPRPLDGIPVRERLRAVRGGRHD